MSWAKKTVFSSVELNMKEHFIYTSCVDQYYKKPRCTGGSGKYKTVKDKGQFVFSVQHSIKIF